MAVSTEGDHAEEVIDDLFDVADDGSVVLRLHVQPGAGRTAMVSRHGDAVKVRVAAPPEHGRANDACVALVASTFGIPKAQVEVVGGPASREKRLRLTGVESDEVRRLLASALSIPAESGRGQPVPGNVKPSRSVR